MKFIKKGREPEEWKAHKNTPGATFVAIPELKEALLKEQGYLCCYCMSGIKSSRMKVEHFKPRRHKDSIMKYTNLHAACTGDFCGEHCDTLKKDSEIQLSPTNRICNCERIISYKSNGFLTYPEEYRIEVEEVLNLNNSVLVKNRKKAIEGTILALQRKGFKPSTIRKEIKNTKTKDENGKFRPYCMIILWILNKKLSAN